MTINKVRPKLRRSRAETLIALCLAGNSFAVLHNYVMNLLNLIYMVMERSIRPQVCLPTTSSTTTTFRQLHSYQLCEQTKKWKETLRMLVNVFTVILAIIAQVHTPTS